MCVCACVTLGVRGSLSAFVRFLFVCRGYRARLQTVLNEADCSLEVYGTPVYTYLPFGIMYHSFLLVWCSLEPRAIPFGLLLVIWDHGVAQFGNTCRSSWSGTPLDLLVFHQEPKLLRGMWHSDRMYTLGLSDDL